MVRRVGLGRRHRRDEDALIAELQEKIQRLEEKKKLREMKNDPVVREANRLVRGLRKAEGFFDENGRIDLANSVKAARLSIEAQIYKGIHG